MAFYNPQEDPRKDIRRAEKGTQQHIDKVKFVREQTGLSLRETVDLVACGSGLSAGEIAERYSKNKNRPVTMDPDSLPVGGYRVWAPNSTGLSGFYETISPELQKLIDTTPGMSVDEMVYKKEALDRMKYVVWLEP
jgi:hypothetical protein